MTPYRSGKRGTYILDRVFPGLGRIRRASGTTDRRIFDALNGMLSTLWATGRLDYLEAIRTGVMHPLHVLGQLRDRAPSGLPGVDAGRPAVPLLEAWLATLPEGQARYVRSYADTFFGRVGAVTLAGLPEALRAYRTRLAEHPVQFNRTKYVVHAFLRVLVGKRHALYLAVADVPRLREAKRPGAPFTPSGLAQGVRQAQQPFAAMCWTMALTGMRLNEYWGRWSATEDRVEIRGTKTAGSHRLVPVAGELVRPGYSRSHFKLLFRRTLPGHTPYDLRRSFAHWMELAGIVDTRARLYLGHAARTVSDRYRWHAVEPYLQADGAQLRDWLTAQVGRGLEVVG